AAALANTASAQLGGAARAGEFWNLTVTVPSGTVSVSVPSGTTLAATAQALANAINASADPDAASLTMSTEGSMLVIANRASGAVTISASSVTPVGTSVVAAGSASRVALAVSGLVVADETWTLTLASGSVTRAITYTAAASDGVAQVLQALAATINADPALAFAGKADASTLSLLRSSGESFTATLAVAPAGTASVDAASARTTLVTLSGQPVTGERWRLEVAGVSYDVTVDSTSVATLADIAAALAAQLDASAFTATSEGAELLIVNSSGAAFTSSLAIVPAKAYTVDTAAKSATVALVGAPVAGEAWTLRLGTLAYSVIFGGAVDSLQKIAEGLAAAINADTRSAALAYTATTEGTTLVIVNRAGAAFTPGLQITPV